jgi:hypothetical protein
VLPQDVLARPALRVPAREHRGQAPHDLAVLGLRAASLLVPSLDQLEDLARGVEPLPEMLGHTVALARRVRDPPELGRMHLEPGGELRMQLGVQGSQGLGRLVLSGFEVLRVPPPQHDRRAGRRADAGREQGDQQVGGHAVTFPGVVARGSWRNRTPAVRQNRGTTAAFGATIAS